MELIESVKEKIKKERELQGYTQTDMANMLNIKRQQYSLFENHAEDIKLTFLLRIANVFEINIKDLI